MTKYYTVISGKGGVGKTTTSINLGSALNYFDYDVTVVDANLGTPNVGLHLGVPIVPINLHHVLRKENTITEAVYLHPTGTKIIPGGISIEDLKTVNPNRLHSVIHGLEGTTDYVLIDAAAGLGVEALAAITAGDEVIIVTNPELPAITDALKTIRLCQEMKRHVLGVVLTRTKRDNLDVSVKNIETILEKPIIGIIPEDRKVREALIAKDSVVYIYPRSKAAIGYKRLAANLIGRKYTPEIKVKKDSFLGKILSRLKRIF